MMNDYLKMIDELLLIKASVELLDTTNQKVKTDLLDYIDTLIAEYNSIIERYEEELQSKKNCKGELDFDFSNPCTYPY